MERERERGEGEGRVGGRGGERGKEGGSKRRRVEREGREAASAGKACNETRLSLRVFGSSHLLQNPAG